MLNNSSIFFSFISRSGGHAIIYWMAAHFSKEIRYEHYWNKKSKIVFFQNGEEFRKPKTEYDQFDLRFYSIENVCEPVKEKFNQRPIPDIVVIRSPENLYASLYRKAIKSKWYIEESEIQKTYLNHLNTKGYLILYDLWFSSEKYRKKIAQDLGLTYTQKNLDFVSSFGSGSSFDGGAYKGRAQEMKVLERWKQIPTDVYTKFRNENEILFTEYEKMKKIHQKFC